MAFSVTPTSGAQPYLLEASFNEQYLIDGVNYLLRIRSTTSEGVCPAVGITLGSETWTDNLLQYGEHTVVSTVPQGSCRTTTLQIFDVSNNIVIDEKSVFVSNL